MSGSLSGRTALVTGAAGVLGGAIAKRLARDGAALALLDLPGPRLDAVARELSDPAAAIACDLADAEAITAAIGMVRERFGSVDILVNNAGILSNNKAAETSFDEWRKVMAVNLDGAFWLIHHCLPAMKEKRWGRIVNICSLASKTGGLTAGTAYTASKGGLVALTFSVAREAAAYGVTANGIAPAYIKTPMVTDQLTEQQRQDLLKQIPVGRFLDADEVADLVAYLTSPTAGFVTGEIVDINGGLHFD
jgi:3-oxoacyl-[acyl-carrier protein] reductase